MNELPFYNQVLVIVINLTGLWLIHLFHKNSSRRKVNLFFVISAVMMFLWVDFAYLARLVGPNYNELALIFLRVAWFATPLLFVSIYFLIVFYFKRNKKYSLLSKINFVSGLTLAFVTGLTDFVVKDVNFVYTTLNVVYGPLMVIFLGIIFFFIVSTVSVLIIEFLKIERRNRVKVEYLLFGILIFYLFNLVFNIVLPIFFDLANFYWIGDYSSIILLGFIFYAIVKEELFGIKVILTEVVVMIVSILLFINIFFSNNRFEYIWNSSLFIIFLFFGFFLIRSVLRRAKAKAKVSEYAKKLQEANERLQELDQQKTEFISFAAHQLRSPLTSVKGFASLILEGSFGKMPPKIENAIKNIFDSSGAMIRSVEDFLNITRMEQGRMDYDIENIDLYQVAQAVSNELHPSAYEKKLDLSISPKEEREFKVKADEGKTRHVIMNLVDNAIKYTKEGYVKIELSKNKNGTVRLTVSDSGMGMSPKTIKKLFKKYSRSKSAHDIQGTGLGMFIAKKIVEAQNGKIWAESPGEGQGSTFYLELPPGE